MPRASKLPRLPALTPTATRYRSFLDALRLRGFEGEVSDGAGDRLALATDNSIYQVEPQAVAFPRTVGDLQRIASLLADPQFAGLAIAPRGGGTGTNGQSLTDGLVVDVSRHMNAVLEIDPAGRWARMQAGVVKDQLNAALAPHGLMFAPELSTSNRATIGGMISTDACGQGSCLYGKTRDHVLELTSVLSDGTVWTSRPVDADELAQVQVRRDRVGEVHRVIGAIARDQAALIAERFPPLNRCLTGYDLAHVRDRDGRFDLNAILCGSEGTLAFLAEAKLNLVPIPRHTALVNVSYASFDAALRDARSLLRFAPASIETIDSTVLALARGDSVWNSIGHFFPAGSDEIAGINLVEFIAETEDALEQLVRRVTQALADEASGGARRGFTVAHHDEVASLWSMRKRAVGLLGNMEGEARPIPFVEDTAVPPERLADYIADFRAALDARGLTYGMFGHVDAGVLHVRPAIDMKDPAQEALIRAVTEDVVRLTRACGGLLWGEHGKGVRSEFLPETFGPLYPALQRIKAAFDPHNQFNPGKIAAPPGAALLTIDGVPTRGQRDRQIPAPLRASHGAALHCNGNGACFNWDPDDAMCPSWKATRDRRHSPKGRAGLIREWLRRAAEAERDPTTVGRDDFSHVVKEAMDGCLGCKACAGQCPIRVDIPASRAKFLHAYHTRYRRPLRDYLVARLEPTLPLLQHVSGLYNLTVASTLGHRALRAAGLTATPRLSGIDLAAALRTRNITFATPERLAALPAPDRARAVVLVQDAFTSAYETGLVIDLLDLLRNLGFTPFVAPLRPNGKPLHVHGFLPQFERAARANAAMLRALEAEGVPLVGLDPSITLTYRQEYAEVIDKARRPTVRLIQEFLADALGEADAPDGPA